MLSREVLLADVRDRLFGAGRGSPQATFGFEIEFIPQRHIDRGITPLFGAGGTLDFVRRFAKRQDWAEHATREQAPWFHTPAGGSITFEPGGQIEYSTPTYADATLLLRDARAAAAGLIDEAARAGIDLVTSGIDPYNDSTAAPLQLHTKRYESMARCFARIGPAGARMMRQTTAVQVNIGLGPDAYARWRLLNKLAPVLTALFANSSQYAGRDTGYASYR
ncbi:MAG TPA: glutamate-cysteine ligase family protein, partial [Longimicrobiales bacterium]|nr:glutamate-cysteine ligase family protein [Longimicrobiales bacterium]